MKLFSTKAVANLKESWQFESQVIAQNTLEICDLTEETPIRILFIGLDENEAYKVRYKLYGFSSIPGVDLGDAGDFLGGNPDQLLSVLNWCYYHKVVPVLLSKNYQQDLANDIMQSSFIPDEATVGQISREARTQFISEKHRNSINIGFQTHRSLPDHLLHRDGIELLRLGELRRFVQDAEPYLRSVHMLLCNLDAVRFSDAPGQVKPSTSGLFSEELCQLFKYVGMNEMNRLIWIYGYQAQRDISNATADLAAQCIWYLMQGINNRKEEYPLDKSKLKAYIVEYSGVDIPLTFYKSDLTSRWWVEINDQENVLIPCAYSDYVQAKSDELSDRLIKLLNIYS